MRNIIVATDLSKAKTELLNQAKKQASIEESKIWILFAAPPSPDFVGFEVGPQYIRDNVAAELRAEHKELQEMAKSLQNEGLNAEAIMAQGPAAEVILYEAKKLDADMIVIGSHGHGAVFSILVGSVCSAVLKKSEIPMLVIPSKES